MISCNQSNVSFKGEVKIKFCLGIHIMHYGVLGFQSNGDLKMLQLFLRLGFCLNEIFGACLFSKPLYGGYKN